MASGKVIVKNNSPRLIGIGKPHNSAQKGITGTAADIRLMPGNNEVDAEAWARAEAIPTIKLMLEDKAQNGRHTLEVEGSVKKSISELPEAEVVKLVGEVYDPKQLDHWAKTDKRERVQAAIEAQRKAIGKTEEEKAKEAKAREEKEKAAAKAR